MPERTVVRTPAPLRIRGRGGDGGRAATWALARVEAVRLLRHPAVLAALLLYLG